MLGRRGRARVSRVRLLRPLHLSLWLLAGPVGAVELPFGAAAGVAAGVDGAAAVVAADIDGDGRLDLVSASANDDTVAWNRNVDGATTEFNKEVIQ